MLLQLRSRPVLSVCALQYLADTAQPNSHVPPLSPPPPPPNPLLDIMLKALVIAQTMHCHLLCICTNLCMALQSEQHQSTCFSLAKISDTILVYNCLLILPCCLPQESERMNVLLSTMRRSLAELDLGLKGDLTMSEPMEKLMLALANDGVPASWANVAYPSLRPLGSWLVNLLQRVSQLVEWTADLGVPKSVWLSGLFNPQSFLTAVMQTTARRNDWPLDKTVVLTEVTKKQPDQIDAPSRDGAFIHGLTLEGARWDEKAGTLDDSRPKELFCPMPVMLVRAVTVDKAEMKDAYQCPVYTTEARFRQEVFTAQLKSKHSWIKWTLAGVCLFLDVV